MSAIPDPPHADHPTSSFPLSRARKGEHRAAEDGRWLMWSAVAAAAVVLLVATLTVVLAGGGDTDGPRPVVAESEAVPDETYDPYETEEPSPTPTSVPSSRSPTPTRAPGPAELLAGLRGTVDGLVRQGQLRRNDGKELDRRLREAERVLAAGDVDGARAKLREFSAKVVDLRRADRISADGYEVLVNGTTRLAQALTGR